ncbi:MAG: antitoxin [Clostridiales bacterium]|nr:antitoxin [Clostridiales bacterium]
MRDEYDIKNLNPRRNPYADKLKKQITIRLNAGTIEYFKQQAEETGISYQNLINMYLTDCAVHEKKLEYTIK